MLFISIFMTYHLNVFLCLFIVVNAYSIISANALSDQDRKIWIVQVNTIGFPSQRALLDKRN